MSEKMEPDGVDGLSIQFCEKRDDETHCRCWWDCGVCCACGDDGSQYGENEEPRGEQS